MLQGLWHRNCEVVYCMQIILGREERSPAAINWP